MMKTSTLLHLSDLHLGRSAADETRARAFVTRVLVEQIDHVVVTGDITNRGRKDELQRYKTIFAPLIESGRLTAVPGNHDRNGDDVAAHIQNGPRVQTRLIDGAYVVRFDSTGPQNRSWLEGHGSMSMEDIQQISDALDEAPTGHLAILLLHHHPLPLPEDTKGELLSSWLGWRWTSELQFGWTLLRRLAGRCDLVLHGHRHQPRAFTLFPDHARPLNLFNAGSSTELAAARLFRHRGGQLVQQPEWWRDHKVKPRQELETFTRPMRAAALREERL
ncbi:MAG: metallophosphoesterase [Deltaproteobacteria bacterium]|nr:metallophosphoesterase [Deltaproteobacteria bacterium]